MPAAANTKYTGSKCVRKRAVAPTAKINIVTQKKAMTDRQSAASNLFDRSRKMEITPYNANRNIRYQITRIATGMPSPLA